MLHMICKFVHPYLLACENERILITFNNKRDNLLIYLTLFYSYAQTTVALFRAPLNRLRSTLTEEEKEDVYAQLSQYFASLIQHQQHYNYVIRWFCVNTFIN